MADKNSDPIEPTDPTSPASTEGSPSVVEPEAVESNDSISPAPESESAQPVTEEPVSPATSSIHTPVEEGVIADPTVSTGPKTVTLTQQALTLWVVGITCFALLVGGALGVSIGLAADSGKPYKQHHRSVTYEYKKEFKVKTGEGDFNYSEHRKTIKPVPQTNTGTSNEE